MPLSLALHRNITITWYEGRHLESSPEMSGYTRKVGNWEEGSG